MAERKNSRLTAMYRRWAYMAVAVIASALLAIGPAFSFLDDKGIIYIRSFSMTQKQFVVTQTELETGLQTVTGVMPIKGLYYCYLAMLFGSIGALLFMMHPMGRIVMCDITMVAAGAYYVMLIVYALKITDIHYATLAPTWIAFLPAIVLEMMALTHRNVLTYGHYLDDDMDDEKDAEVFED